MTDIRKVAVFGAGVMGAGIAAHIANAGVPVVLLDIAAKDGDYPSAIAEGAVKKLLKTDPAPLMHKKNAHLITAGNIDGDMDLIADCPRFQSTVSAMPKASKSLALRPLP